MKIKKDVLTLYAVTDSKYSLENESLFSEQIEHALRGGATCLQLREKNLNEGVFLERAKKLKNICKKFGVPLIINDNVNIAKVVDADGVHIGQEDIPISDAIKILGKNKIIGVSVFNVKEALLAEKMEATYLGVGSIFKTNSKPDAKTVPLSILREICRSVKIPVVAIGGINGSNISKLSGSGVSGVAIISAIFSAKDIEKTTKKFKMLATNTLNRV